MTGVTFKARPSLAQSYCGVSADWDYFCRTLADSDEPVVVEYQGFEFACAYGEDDTRCKVRQFSAEPPSNYFMPLNQTGHRPVPWRALLLALDTPATLSDFSWRYPHDLVEEECALSPVCAFRLPATVDAYLATLSKDNRYEFKRTNRQCQHLSVRMELPSRLEVTRMMDLFAEHQLKKYDWYYNVEEVEAIRLANEIFVARAEALGTLFPMSVYDGDELIAINIAEKVQGHIVDTTPVYDHDRWASLPIGTFLINKNIEAAIAHGCSTYDLGMLDDPLIDHRVTEVYRYKTKWVPRGAVLPQVYGCAVMSAAQKPTPPYFDFDTKELRVAD